MICSGGWGSNFGTMPRDYMPLEPTLARRINAPSVLPPSMRGESPETLKGEALTARRKSNCTLSRIHLARHRNRLRRDSTTLRSLSVQLPLRIFIICLPMRPSLPYPYGPPTTNDMNPDY